MSIVAQAIPLLLLVIGLLLVLASYRLRHSIRPTGHVDYHNTQTEAYIPHGPIIRLEEAIAGQPHGLLRFITERQIVPVLVIDTRSPGTPDPATRMQMALLCLLTELIYDQNVPYGVLRYADHDLPLNWTPGLAQELNDLLVAMRADVSAIDVPRSHDDPSVCYACVVQDYCNQALE